MSTSPSRTSAAVPLSTAATRAKRKRAKITFGGVTILVPKPTAAEVKHNVAKGASALDRLKNRLIKPGVRVYPKKDVPLYFADAERPGIYIRKLNGKTESGVLEDGAFKVIV